MFEFMTNDDRGQVGLGTLIVFIAMVLVAAIAAGVLINTAGFLQSQAEATGEESTDLVSERIDVTSTVGIVGSADDGDLEAIRVGVTGSPGADDIDLSATTVQAVGPNGQANLVFADEYDNTDDGEPDTAIDSVDNIPEGTFAVQDTEGDFIDSDEAVISDDTQFTVVFNPENEPFGGGEDSGEFFGESDESSLDIVSPSSATTSVELNSPDLYNEDGEAVRL